MTTAEEIKIRLMQAFQPKLLEIHDDSALHHGHAGAAQGGGHFRLTMVADCFEGLSRLERHRLVNERLSDLFGPKIHALSLTLKTPDELTQIK